MVMLPVVTALAMALPLTVPKRPLAMTATFPAPPFDEPATARPKSLKKPSRPPRAITAPKATKRKMYVADTSVGMPKTPPVVSIC